MSEVQPGAGFAVELPVFAGPFRLLADLLLEQKIDVCDVPIATVTERFLAHAAEADGWSLEEATWFLAVCAILLELKVARLMPRHEAVDEEDLLGVSPDLVYARSLELAAFRRVTSWIARRLEEEALCVLDLSHVTPIRYTMTEAVRAVREQLARRREARFRELVADCEERIQVVVRFLALLELYREGKVELRQAETFGEIEVRWEEG
jgi:segregation and condensation protein A